ncbi:MAG: hypothetical protein RJB11_460 [Planctomycetota bacterium]
MGAEERHSGFIDGSNSRCLVDNLRAKQQGESIGSRKSTRLHIPRGQSDSGLLAARDSQPCGQDRSDRYRKSLGIGIEVVDIVVDVAAGIVVGIVVGIEGSRKPIAERVLDKPAGRRVAKGVGCSKPQ